MYVLDTGSVVYFFKGMGRVGERLLATPASEVAIPSVVLYELEIGAARSSAPRKRREQIDTLVDALVIAPFGFEEARVAAQLRAELERSGETIGPLDTLIAATAFRLGAFLVTHNVREFERVRGLKIDDWF